MNLLKTILFWLLIELLFIIPGGAWGLLSTTGKINLPSEYIASTGFLLSLAVVSLFLFFFFTDVLKKTSYLLTFTIRNLKLLIISFVSIGVLFFLLVYMGNLAGVTDIGIKQNASLTINKTFLFFLLAFITGVTEEFIFRGALGIYFFEKMKKVPAILLLSALFSIGHLQYSGLLPFITVFIFSICSFCLLLKTKSLYGSIGLHAGWNFSFFLNNHFFNLENHITPFWGNLFELLQIGLMLSVLFVLLFAPMKKLKVEKSSFKLTYLFRLFT